MTEFSATGFPRQHIVPHTLKLVGCMDRRLVKRDDPHLGNDRLFQQIRGGRYGLAGLAIAMEATNPGSFIAMNMNMARFAQLVGNTIAKGKKGILTTKHGPNCGGIEESDTIHNGVANAAESDDVFVASTMFKPDLEESEYEKTIDAVQRIKAARRTCRPQEIKSELTTPKAVLWTPDHNITVPTPHVDLVETNHDEIWFLADYRDDVALDRAAAHADGYGAYYSSFGMFEKILAATPGYVSENVGSVENWWNVEATLLGEVATNVIVHVDDNGVRHPYPIEAIG
jgi:hypothetical protein